MRFLGVAVAGTQAQVCSAGGSIDRDAPWRIGCCPCGKVFSCCLWKRARCSFILGLLCTNLSMTATRAKGSPWEVSLLLQVKGSSSFQIQHWYHHHVLQLCVLQQPTVVASAAQVSPLQHSLFCLAGDGSVK